MVIPRWKPYVTGEASPHHVFEGIFKLVRVANKPFKPVARIW